MYFTVTKLLLVMVGSRAPPREYEIQPDPLSILPQAGDMLGCPHAHHRHVIENLHKVRLAFSHEKTACGHARTPTHVKMILNVVGLEFSREKVARGDAAMPPPAT